MGDSKQVKVDNWGIFFLQRLQTFFNKTYFCDLTLQFEDNVQLKVHRLVMNACTEYFQVLEQTCEVINDCLIMPPDLQADVVVPIVNFMYTGILEFQTSIIDRLYVTARLMNMTVLTKLLDAQKVPISPIPKPMNKRAIAPITWNLQGKKIAPKTMDPDLPEPLPGRKLPIWKRKSIPVTYRHDVITSLPDPLSVKYFKQTVDEAPKPTRFEWPEDEDTNFDTNSFDEISYTSKPIIIPQREKSPKPSTSSNNFEELKRSSVAVKRPASPLYSDSKKVNIQDVKEYIKEQKLRSDYIDYDDSEAADNDLQTYENNNDSDDDNKEEIFEQNSEDSPNKSILKNDASTSHSKRVRFSLEGKENAAKVPQKSGQAATIKTTVDMSNHTKIITEVLKKYPHLVKKNKNIKLKILAKGANVTSSGLKPVGTPVKMTKQAATTKVSYMVMKPGGEASKTSPPDTKKDGHWSCHKCSNPNPLQFETYYLYRKHLTDVHNEKADSQMCNICGHISRKQNMLMYHKLIKHNITPPPSYHFPKCKDCSYIAVSQAMLMKHQPIHTEQNLACAECNTSFTTRSALISHIQVTGHTDKNNCPTYDCTYCTKKFISDETLFQHIKNNHKIEARRDNLLSPLEEEESPGVKKNIITAEEIDAMEEQNSNEQQETMPQVIEKPKEKIKILSDVKVTAAIKNSKLQPVKIMREVPQEPQVVDIDTQQLEPSSEAESLSNVASGIAASLGLVNTIVVLDDNQFILQSQDDNQENIISNPQNIILPDGSNINNIQNLVSQQQVITTDANTIISQATLSKNNITSTDELVMVLTDHDYSDASNNAVITSENSNIVVLYSHPVQNQDGQFISQPGNLVINSDMGLVEVDNNYADTNAVPMHEKCEESIELIQQEIDNHIEDAQQEPEKSEEQTRFVENKTADVQQENQESNEDTPKEIIADPEPEPEKMEVDPDEQIQEDSQQLSEEQPEETSEEHQHQLTEDHQQISENQQITEEPQIIEHRQQSVEEHQQVTDDQQQVSEDQQMTDHQQLTDEHGQMTDDQQRMTDDHQQMTDEHQQMTDEHQQMTDHKQLTDKHQQMTDHKQLTDEHQQMTDHKQLTDEHHQISEDHQQITGEYHQQITEDHQQITGEYHQQITEKNVQESELLPSTEESAEIQTPSHEAETNKQALETVQAERVESSEKEQPIPEETKNTSSEDNQYEEPMEIEESIEMIQKEIHRTEQPKVVPQNVAPNSEDNITEKETNIENVSEIQPNQETAEKAETKESVETNEEFTKENEDNINQETINKETKDVSNEEQQEIEYMEVDSAKSSKNESEYIEPTIDETKTSDSVQDSENIPEQNTEPQEQEPQIQPEENVKSSQQEQDNQPAELEQPESIENLTESNSDKNQEHEEICDQQTNETRVEEALQDTETSQDEVQLKKEPVKELSEPKPVAKETEKSKDLTNSKISNLLDDWDDGDTDSQQSDTPKPTADGRRVVNTLINDWEDDEET